MRTSVHSDQGLLGSSASVPTTMAMGAVRYDHVTVESSALGPQPSAMETSMHAASPMYGPVEPPSAKRDTRTDKTKVESSAVMTALTSTLDLLVSWAHHIFSVTIQICKKLYVSYFKFQWSFYPSYLRPKGYCYRLRLSVCPSVPPIGLAKKWSILQKLQE